LLPPATIIKLSIATSDIGDIGTQLSFRIEIVKQEIYYLAERVVGLVSKLARDGLLNCRT